MSFLTNECEAAKLVGAAKRISKYSILAYFLCAVSATLPRLNAGDWPAYRGPLLTAESEATNLPAEWSETINLAWKLPLEGRAWSSPIICRNTIWLTNATPDGKEQSIIGVDCESGKVAVEKLLFRNDQVQKDYDPSNSYASPTPVTDGQRLYGHFGAYGTACLDIEKDRSNPILLWQRRDLPCNHFRGPGSSPILFENLLIFHMDGFDYHYAVALNKETGETVWKKDRDIDYGTNDGDWMKSFATPIVIEFEHDGQKRTQLISPSAKAIVSLDPRTGEEFWRVRYDEHSSAARPVFDGDYIYTNTGFSKGRAIAIDPSGSGDVSSTHVKWELARGIGNKPSLALYRDWLYSIEDRGVVTCIKKSDGKIAWQKRVGGDFTASPLIADNKLYCFDEAGKAYVYAADDTGDLLAENLLEDGCKASPAAVDNYLLVRTKSFLYRIQKQ